MTREMTHDEARDALGAAALDALSEEERRAVLAHAATCAECGPELAALGDVAAALAHAAPRASLDPARSAAIRGRLEARAAADVAARQSALGTRRVERSAPARPARRVSPAWWLAAAAVVALAIAGLRLVDVARERDRLRAALVASRAAGVRGARQLDSLRTALADRDRLVSVITGPEVRVVELTASGQRAPGARMFWDRATNRWTMFAYNLQPPAAGRTYQLWLVTRDQRRISAGTFAPDASGSAVVSAEYSLPAGALQAVAVTDEPAGGVRQPTGPMVLVGSAGR